MADEDTGLNPVSDGEPSPQEETGEAEGHSEEKTGGEGQEDQDTGAADSDDDGAEGGEEEGAAGEGEQLSKRQRQRQRKKEADRLRNERLRELEAENRQLQSELDRTSKSGEGLKRPNPDDYDEGREDPEYISDLSVYKLKKADAEGKTEDLQTRSKAKAEEISKERNQRWSEQKAEGRTRFDDFDSVINQLSEHDLTPEMAAMIADSEDAAGLAYTLGKNPGLAREISRMHPMQQMRRLVEIETRLAAQTRGRKPANPPDPVETVTGKSSRAVARTPYNARSDDEYIALRRKQENEALKRNAGA